MTVVLCGLGAAIPASAATIAYDGSASSAVDILSFDRGLSTVESGKSTGSTTWQQSDQDGLVADTGISEDGMSFRVVWVDVPATGDGFAWLWLNLLFDIEPGLASSNVSRSSESFEADLVQLQLENQASAGIDEVSPSPRLPDVATSNPPVRAPEPGSSTLLGLGLVGLCALDRRVAWLRQDCAE